MHGHVLSHIPDSRVAGAHPQRHCVDCPALRAGCLHGLVGRGSAECHFETLVIEARTPFALPAGSSYRLGWVRRGLLVRERPGADGRRVAVDVVCSGGAFYIDRRSAAEPDVCVGYAVTRTLLCMCPEAALERGLGEPGTTALELHELGMCALTRVECISEARGRSEATARVGALLCVLHDTLSSRPDPSGRLPAGLQQRDFARLLSLRHESVCRVLRQLSERGWIAQSADGIQIVDRAALQAQ